MDLDILVILILILILYNYDSLSKVLITAPLTASLAQLTTSLTTPLTPPGPQCPDKMINNGTSLCYTPCDPGFTFDNDHLCKKPGNPVNFVLSCNSNDIVKPGTQLCTSPATPPTPTWGCDSNRYFNTNSNGSGTCWLNMSYVPAYLKCPQNWSYDGTSCHWASDYTAIKSCPDGYKFNDTATQCVPYFYTTNTQKLN